MTGEVGIQCHVSDCGLVFIFCQNCYLGLSEPEQSASSSISIPTDVKYHCLQKARRSSRAKDYVAYALNLCRQVFTEEEWVNTRVNGSGIKNIY